LIQINCAHLENCLHEAREEARTNKCSADRRAVEYDALRSSALRIHGLFERLNNCVTSPGMSGFADSLRSLALSIARYHVALLCIKLCVHWSVCISFQAYCGRHLIYQRVNGLSVKLMTNQLNGMERLHWKCVQIVVFCLGFSSESA
jgi:hypothetical protein